VTDLLAENPVANRARRIAPCGTAPVVFGAFALFAACEKPHPPPQSSPPHAFTTLSQIVIEAPSGTPRPPYRFSPEDDRFLDEVQRGAFNFMWHAGESTPTGMVPDRSSKTVVSIAGVGFQLASLCAGVERGWITRDQGRRRAERILGALAANPSNRKAGLFYHFLDPDSAGQPAEAPEHVVSTIDSAILFAGMLTAGSFFGGPVRQQADALFEAADWRFFVLQQGQTFPTGFISLGWQPRDLAAPTADGDLLEYAWIDCGDEHRLVTFLAASAPDESRRVDPILYYRLRRQVGAWEDTGPMVWFPWSGALFTQFFAHLFIDYAGMGTDDPGAFGISNRPRVDWWENSRRHVSLHRLKAREYAGKVPTVGDLAWGFSASDVQSGYAVPGVFPAPLPMPSAIPEVDYATFTPKDDPGDGTIAPYAAGCAVLFDPAAALAALRYYRSLDLPGLWADPGSGGCGFADAFNLGSRWVAPDYVAIDQGALVLAIENARTGLIWEHFHTHPFIRAGMERLRLSRVHRDKATPR
jgi:hypothetical protein